MSPIMSNSWRTPGINTPIASSPHSNKSLNFPPESTQTTASYVSYPSIKMMIKNVSTIKCNKAGELGENFLSLYNSKTHWGLDI